ncbi:UNVERIFIED_CONTAM: Sp7 [Trichonephila clavipes]
MGRHPLEDNLCQNSAQQLPETLDSGTFLTRSGETGRKLMKGQMNGLDIPVIMSRMRADTARHTPEYTRYNKKHTLFLEIKNADLDLFVRYLISYGYRYRRKKYLATLKARLGEYDTSASSDSRQDFGIETLITHPQYQEPYRQSNDIALLRLNKDAVFTEHVWPVCLPIRNTDVTGMNATVAGWGQTSFIGISTRRLSGMKSLLIYS